ncbi:MAG: FHA domain-containing protein [Kofleriaceae bacterium]
MGKAVRVVVDAGGQRYAEHIPRGSVVRVGRAGNNEIRLKTGAISRHQCTLTFTDEGVFVEDTNVPCGTYLDGRKMSVPTLVPDGAEIQTGDFRLRILR